MLPVYNDEDIIQEVIEHLISQEIPLVVLDNGSTDNTYKICEKFLGQGILQLQQYKTSTYIYQWGLIIRILYDMAMTRSPDWVIRSDSDEILESGKKNMTLKEAITQVDEEGYNLIQFDRFDFYMTDHDNESAKSMKDKFPYYSCYGDYIYRSWKYFPGIRPDDAGGHYPIFPEDYKYKIYPKKFVLRHYPFRNNKQAEKKMTDRTRGTNYLETKGKDHSVYTYHLKKNIIKQIDHRILTKYLENGEWDLELKYCPLLKNTPSKKEDIFSEDGFLKTKQPTLYELKLLLREKKNKSIISRFKEKIKK